ncbi:MAG: hypothetical protein R3C12_20280 [Planctomycetaceae bacterium]
MILRSSCAVACLGILFSCLSVGIAAERSLVKIAVYPPQVKLKTAKDLQTIVVQAFYADGITEDITSQTEFRLEGTPCVRIEEMFCVRSRTARRKRSLRIFTGYSPSPLYPCECGGSCGASAGQLQARCDARLYADWLQHGELSRGGPRQGWL